MHFICFAWVYAPQISTENWTQALWSRFPLQQFATPAAAAAAAVPVTKGTI